MEEKKNNIKFYNKSWFMWFTCFFFAPIGLFIMWKKKRLNSVVRVLLTITFAFVFIIQMVSVFSPKGDTASTDSLTIAQSSNTVKEDKKAQPVVKKLSPEELKKKAAEDKLAAKEKAMVDAASARQHAKVKKAADYKAWVDGQFDPWDGSNTYLVNLIKENMNDPGSFKHDKTVYWDMKTYLIVKMTYRGKNAFGALILQNVTARSDYKTNTIKITSQND